MGPAICVQIKNDCDYKPEAVEVTEKKEIEVFPNLPKWLKNVMDAKVLVSEKSPLKFQVEGRIAKVTGEYEVKATASGTIQVKLPLLGHFTSENGAVAGNIRKEDSAVVYFAKFKDGIELPFPFPKTGPATLALTRKDVSQVTVPFIKERQDVKPTMTLYWQAKSPVPYLCDEELTNYLRLTVQMGGVSGGSAAGAAGGTIRDYASTGFGFGSWPSESQWNGLKLWFAFRGQTTCPRDRTWTIKTKGLDKIQLKKIKLGFSVRVEDLGVGLSLGLKGLRNQPTLAADVTLGTEMRLWTGGKDCANEDKQWSQCLYANAGATLGIEMSAGDGKMFLTFGVNVGFKGVWINPAGLQNFALVNPQLSLDLSFQGLPYPIPEGIAFEMQLLWKRPNEVA